MGFCKIWNTYGVVFNGGLNFKFFLNGRPCTFANNTINLQSIMLLEFFHSCFSHRSKIAINTILTKAVTKFFQSSLKFLNISAFIALLKCRLSRFYYRSICRSAIIDIFQFTPVFPFTTTNSGCNNTSNCTGSFDDSIIANIKTNMWLLRTVASKYSCSRFQIFPISPAFTSQLTFTGTVLRPNGIAAMINVFAKLFKSPRKKTAAVSNCTADPFGTTYSTSIAIIFLSSFIIS